MNFGPGFYDLISPTLKNTYVSNTIEVVPLLTTRIFGAFGPIMFALRVWVGFGASWRSETLFLNSSFMFGRTHGSVFGRTLFKIQ